MLRRKNGRTTAATAKEMPRCSIKLQADERMQMAATMILAATMTQSDEEIQSVVESDRGEDRIRDRRK